MKNVRISDILHIYDKEISKNTKNKKKIYNFEKYKMMNINSIYEKLNTNDYDGGIYNIFLIRRPKYRIVMSLNINDKVINHYIARYSLMSRLERYLDNRCVATRKNLGRDYGIKLVKKYFEKMKKYDKFYILKLDISKYFYNIDHTKLKSMLKEKIEDNDEYEFICKIIDSTNKSYINKHINIIKNRELNRRSVNAIEVSKLPLYKIGKGLQIGNMTSQFLSIFYLNEIDHMIIHNFHIKEYVRYMDDFLLFLESKEKLKIIYNKLIMILKNEYLLDVNLSKSGIVSAKEGISFCGYKFRIDGKKTIITVSSSTRKRVINRTKEIKKLYMNNKISLYSAFSSYNTYYNGFKYGQRMEMRNIINHYFFGDKNVEKQI